MGKKGEIILRNQSRLPIFRYGPLAIRTVFTVVAVLLSSLVIPATSSAVSLTGESSTYLQSRQTGDGTKELPLYEYLNFSVSDLGKESISFQFGGWLRYELKNGDADHRTTNDLSYAYLSYRNSVANTMVNVGRILVFEGVASDRVDGVYVKTDLKHNFGLSAYGGMPAETGTDLAGNKNIYGTRLSYQSPGLYQIGLSYLKEEKNSEQFRKEEGVDLWVKPVAKVELMGKSRYNAINSAWSDHSYFLVLGPFSKLRLSTEATQINYKDYFTGTTSSVFDLSKSSIDPNDKVRILGEEAAFKATDTVSVSLDYKAYTYEIAGKASYYGGKIAYSSARTVGAGLSLHKMAGETNKLKYDEYRIYGFRKIGHTEVTVDALDVKYAEAINDVKDAYSLTLAAAYEISPSMKLGADVEYSKNPDFDKDLRTMIKLTYLFDTAKTGNKAAAQGAPKAGTIQQAMAAPLTEQGKPKEGN